MGSAADNVGNGSAAPSELGRCWMEMEPFEGPADFLEKLGRARHVVNAPSASGRRIAPF